MQAGFTTAVDEVQGLYDTIDKAFKTLTNCQYEVDKFLSFLTENGSNAIQVWINDNRPHLVSEIPKQNPLLFAAFVVSEFIQAQRKREDILPPLTTTRPRVATRRRRPPPSVIAAALTEPEEPKEEEVADPVEPAEETQPETQVEEQDDQEVEKEPEEKHEPAEPAELAEPAEPTEETEEALPDEGLPESEETAPAAVPEDGEAPVAPTEEGEAEAEAEGEAPVPKPKPKPKPRVGGMGMVNPMDNQLQALLAKRRAACGE
ncbi:hypothetical protein J8273_4668 [Carpediemonas membranifera]|uniref:Uncharacterized protein n=1 Tax=Carpediemonas membranifera TaxID=201153 RepID=A0A8J6E9U0_9EUKA|nr:hypothetical protein J8273_4668 [Carpediemonas membranifera]|eukprot:KAG9393805.1 hypothetical protein J8273_4668 [Carpediemonas membranifera]